MCYYIPRCLLVFTLCGSISFSITEGNVSTTCYGSEPICTTHAMSCPPDLVVYILTASYGYRPNCSSVGISNCDNTSCCMEEEDDCFLPFQSTIVDNLRHNCSSSPTCSLRGFLSDQMCDSERNLRYSSYSKIEYTCLRKGETPPTTTPPTTIPTTTTPTTTLTTTPPTTTTPTTAATTVPTTVSTSPPSGSSVQTIVDNDVTELTSTTFMKTSPTVETRTIDLTDVKLIVGAAVGGLALLVIMTCLIVYFYRRKKEKEKIKKKNERRYKDDDYNPYYSTIRSIDEMLSARNNRQSSQERRSHVKPPLPPCDRKGILKAPRRLSTSDYRART